VKVVALVTQSTTKLVLNFLEFSRFLYKHYKLQLKHSKGKESNSTRVPGTFQLHNSTLGFNTHVPTRMKLMHRDPGGAGELAAGEGSRELTHKRRWMAI
jgi:hypothetical protein